MRFGSAGEPLRWYISQPPQSGPSTCQSVRLPSAVSTNAPFRVPTKTRTPLICRSPSSMVFSPYDEPATGNSSSRSGAVPGERSAGEPLHQERPGLRLEERAGRLVRGALVLLERHGHALPAVLIGERLHVVRVHDAVSLAVGVADAHEQR